jgi:hypothetical protein
MGHQSLARGRGYLHPAALFHRQDLPPEGNESAIRAHLLAAQAKAVVRALIEACQQT